MKAAKMLLKKNNLAKNFPAIRLKNEPPGDPPEYLWGSIRLRIFHSLRSKKFSLIDIFARNLHTIPMTFSVIIL